MARKRRSKITDEQRAEILRLAEAGLNTRQIAEETGLDARRVGGVTSNIGRQPSPVVRTPNQIHIERPTDIDPVPNPDLAQESAPTPRRKPTQRPREETHLRGEPLMEAGFNFGTQSAGGTAGFSYAGVGTKYLVERIVPPDGFLGQHGPDFDVVQLGKLYGEGQYKVTRQTPGKLPVEAIQTIGPACGPSRYPGKDTGEPRRPDERPAARSRPPWDRNWQTDPYVQRMMEFGRTSTMDPTGSEAVKSLSRMTEKLVTQNAEQRNRPPEKRDDSIEKTFKTIMDEQNARSERDRKQERDRDDERRRTEQERWERRQEEGQKSHDREMDRIRADAKSREDAERERRDTMVKAEEERRKTFAEVEEKRLNLVREEAKLHRESTEREAKLNREASERESKAREEKMADELEKNRQEMTGMREAIGEEFDKAREDAKREYDLRRQYLDKEREFSLKEIELLRQASEAQGGGDTKLLLDGLNSLGNQVQGTVKEIVELKKVEAMADAGHPAPLPGVIQGNVMPEPGQQAAPAQQGAGGNGNGNGGAGQQEGRPVMQNIVDRMLGTPLFKDIVKEWALHIEAGNDPCTFANMYLEWMKDPYDAETRKACSVFANYMAIRDWKAMHETMRPHLDAETLVKFDLDGAGDFYEGFRALVHESIRDYYDQLLEQRRQRAAQAEAEAQPEGTQTPRPA